MTSNATPELDQSCAALTEPIELRNVLRSINEALEQRHEMAPVDAVLIDITNTKRYAPSGSPLEPETWTLSRHMGFDSTLPASSGAGAVHAVRNFAQFCKPLTSKQTDADQAWGIWQKYTRSNVSQLACALGWLVIQKLLEQKVVIRAGSANEARVTNVEIVTARVANVPSDISPLIKFVDANGIAILPIKPLFDVCVLQPQSADDLKFSRPRLISFLHQWLIITVCTDAGQERFMHCDFAGPALNVFSTDAQKHNPYTTLPLVIFYDDDQAARSYNDKYACIMDNQETNSWEVLTPERSKAVVQAARKNPRHAALVSPLLFLAFEKLMVFDKSEKMYKLAKELKVSAPIDTAPLDASQRFEYRLTGGFESKQMSDDDKLSAQAHLLASMSQRLRDDSAARAHSLREPVVAVNVAATTQLERRGVRMYTPTTTKAP